MSTCVKKLPFAELPDGRVVREWRLRGTRGMEISVISYGGILRQLNVQDREGNLADVVLGYTRLEDYLNDPFFMGATVGPVAGRIARGSMRVAGKDYSLPINHPPNHLHGGPKALHTRLWEGNVEEETDGTLVLSLHTSLKDGEIGYPGNVDYNLRYAVTPENTLRVETWARSDQTTPVSLTHHSYFNLRGEGNGTVLDHEYQFLSDEIIASDEDMTLLDLRKPVEETAADFRSPAPLRNRIDHLWQQHGDLYWLGENEKMTQAANVTEPSTGRRLEVFTTQPCLQTYFANGLDGTIPAKGNGSYEQFGAFCLECENYPQAMNTTGFGPILVHPDQPQHHITEYRFSTL